MHDVVNFQTKLDVHQTNFTLLVFLQGSMVLTILTPALFVTWMFVIDLITTNFKALLRSRDTTFDNEFNGFHLYTHNQNLNDLKKNWGEKTRTPKIILFSCIYIYIYIYKCGGRVYLGIKCSMLW